MLTTVPGTGYKVANNADELPSLIEFVFWSGVKHTINKLINEKDNFI